MSLNACAWVLLACGACGAPVVDKFDPAPIQEDPINPCQLDQEPWPECDAPDVLVNTLIAPRPLRASPCSASDGGSIVEGECSMPARGASWRNKEVRIASDEPREVTLSAVDAVDAIVHLAGPVTLRFENDALVERVAISSDSADAAVVFDHVTAKLVTLGDVERPFAGHVIALHTRFDGLSMQGASLELDSVVMVAGFVAAERLDSGDGVFDDVVLDVGDALFAPALLQNTRFLGCRSLSFFGAKLSNSIIPRCEGEPTRLYDVTAEKIVLDGIVRAESGVLKRAQLGRYEPSEFVLWGVSVANAMFCDHADSVKATGGIACSYCTEQAFSEGEPCNLEAPAELEENPCASLELAHECEAPLPARYRRPARY